MSKSKKPTVEFRWEAYGDDGIVVKRGPIRDDLSKVEKYADEIRVGIESMKRNDPEARSTWTPAPYWADLNIRIVTRTISPWTSMQLQDTVTKV